MNPLQIDMLLQAGVSFLIGFSSRFKWVWKIFLTSYVILVLVCLFFQPAETGVSLGDGLFTWWRWVITIPLYFVGYWLAGKVQK